MYTQKSTILFAALLTQSCLFPGDGSYSDYPMPTIELADVQLVDYPPIMDLAAYYCPEFLDGFLCATLGPTPDEASLVFYFDMTFDAGNNGSLPLPVAELLVAMNVFQDLDEQTLGSVCVSFCDEADPECTGAPGPEACTIRPSDIDTLPELAGAAAEFIFIAVSDDESFKDNTEMKVIPPYSNLTLKVTFGLDVTTTLSLLWTAAEQALDDFLSGNEIVLEIPYSVNGNIWIDVPNFGRLSFPYGTLEGVFVID